MTSPDENPGNESPEQPAEPQGPGPGEETADGISAAADSSVKPAKSTDPPPLPRPQERPEKQRANDAVSKAVIKRLGKSIGISLPRNRYRVFLGKGAIPPVSETKQFVAPLAEINKVRIRILEGDDDQADRNEFLGEIGINGIRLREDGKAELELEFSLNATGILMVRLSDRIGEAECMARFSLSHFRKEMHDEADISSIPVDELAKKIDLLEQQMQTIKGEIEVRREKR